ncbi:MAG: DUF3575 domain-containing protein [Dysgonamonadaceae bacterium]|jgi:hypothetical protein|nr:DUF3575 domain-containing protein [Dysgonamonadaceae bacterium]
MIKIKRKLPVSKNSTFSLVLFFLLSAFNLIQAQEILPDHPEQQYTEHITVTPPRWNLKTNLLHGAIGSFNLGAEFRTGERTSLDIPLSWNPWTFSDNRKWKHFLFQPEFRLWTNEVFSGHFFGLHAHYAYYNVGNLPKPFSPYMQAHRFQGWLAGAGVSYGYRWNFGQHWGLEAIIGAGYAYLSYDRFECGKCGEFIDSKGKNYFGPTRAGLSLIYGMGASQTVERIALPMPEPVIIYNPTFVSSFITPPVEDPKIRNEVGSVFLDFAIGRVEIVPTFRNNAAELQKLHSQLQAVMNDPDATITAINMTGHASPDGGAARNLQLSHQRVTALKNYVSATYNIPENLITARGAGEDWETFEQLITASNIEDKQRILEIIRSNEPSDVRERQLINLSGGRPWRVMMNEMFPALRRADYQLHYAVVPFTVEKGKEVFRTRPGNLSLNEMFLIAQTYTPRSPEHNELFETAARLFPDSDVANLNAAAAALDRRDAVTAAHHLNRVKEHNSVYWNNMGIMQFLQGNKTEAVESFRKSGTAGANNAEELNRHLQSLQPR